MRANYFSGQSRGLQDHVVRSPTSCQGESKQKTTFFWLIFAPSSTNQLQILSTCISQWSDYPPFKQICSWHSTSPRHSIPPRPRPVRSTRTPRVTHLQVNLCSYFRPCSAHSKCATHQFSWRIKRGVQTARPSRGGLNLTYLTGKPSLSRLSIKASWH